MQGQGKYGKEPQKGGVQGAREIWKGDIEGRGAGGKGNMEWRHRIEGCMGKGNIEGMGFRGNTERRQKGGLQWAREI